MNYLNVEDLDNSLSNLISKEKIDFNYISKSTDDTKKLATSIAKFLHIGDIIVLNGELGAGKTVFLTGIAKHFGIESEVSSPTFTIVNEYDILNSCPIYHFDVYRLQDSDEFLEGIGTDYFYNGICIIEWGNIIKEILPKNTIYIDISKDNDNEDLRYFHIWREN